MILQDKWLQLTSRTVVREVKRADDERDPETGMPLVTKALMVMVPTVLAYYAAKWIYSDLADWVGTTFPDASDSPTLRPLFKALGLTKEEAMGSVPDTLADSATNVQRTPDNRMQDIKEGLVGVDEPDFGTPTRPEVTKEMRTIESIEPKAPVALTKLEKIPKAPEQAAGAPQRAPQKTETIIAKKTKELKGVSKNAGTFKALSPAEQTSFDYLVQQKETFRGGKGINADIRARITSSAKKYGIDPAWALAMAQFESGGNPNALSSTGAVGLYQFTRGTAKDYGLTNRFSVDGNIDAGMRLMKANIAALEAENARLKKAVKKEIPIDLTSVYLAHQMGAGGAINIFNAALNKGELSEQTKLNMGLNLGEMTAEKYIASNAGKLASASKDSATDVKIAYNSSVPVPATAAPTIAQEKPAVAPPVVAAAPVPATQAKQRSVNTAPPVRSIAARAPSELFVLDDTVVHY